MANVENKNAIHALAAVAVAGGAAGFTMTRGLNTPVNTGAGDYSFHYDQPIDANDSVVLGTCRYAAGIAAPTFVRTDDNHLQMLTWEDTGAAIDNVDTDILVIRI